MLEDVAFGDSEFGFVASVEGPESLAVVFSQDQVLHCNCYGERFNFCNVFQRSCLPSSAGLGLFLRS